jgi:divalent metal cation (Fe/Co/Zn/Cd) transporter
MTSEKKETGHSKNETIINLIVALIVFLAGVLAAFLIL